jgi:hypothetical protein
MRPLSFDGEQVDSPFGRWLVKIVEHLDGNAIVVRKAVDPLASERCYRCAIAVKR